tara:strand:+ start:375 stop:1544 length:1170 start_codon:yes stop_codon:yes gene_type:complete
MIAERISRISPSATLQMTARAAELRSSGIDVINLSVGEPDFPTPRNIRDAATFAIENGVTKYTPGPGTIELRKAIAKKLSRDNNLNYKHQSIIVSCGGKHSLYNACQALFQKNDEVIIFTPYWVSFPDFVSITGAKPIFVKTNPDKQFEPQFNDLIKKVSKNTKAIIINSPSNPTGGVWSDESIKQVLEIANDNDLWVFSDECYEQLTYEKPFKSIATYDNKSNKILTFQSCSKTYAMTGWRIGYMAGDINVVQAMSKLQGQSTSCPNSIAQYAAIEALTGDQTQIKNMRNIFKLRRDYIVSELNNINGIKCNKPMGAFYVFPDFSHYIDNVNIKGAYDLSMLFLEKKAVITVAGNAFGSNNNIRLSYAASENELSKAIKLINEVLKNL